MGLIICPHCGKQVSDTNSKCFHCGFDFVSKTGEPEKLRDYHKISMQEQQDLRDEYLNQQTAFKKYMQKYNGFLKKINISYIINLISWICLAIAWAGGFLYHKISKNNAANWVIILILLLVASILVSLIINVVQRKILFKKYRRNELIIEKNYQQWLKSEKNINYTVTFTAKQSKDKVFFDEINIARDKIED